MVNSMDERLASFREQIGAAVASGGSDEITYKSEWLGYLPFGVYHWLEYLGQDLSNAVPAGWTLADLTCLEQAGFLQRLDTYENPEDEFDRSIRYRVCIERR
jgi:hypothetical protein